MLDAVAGEVRDGLAAWDLGGRIRLAEIQHARRASRTWHVYTATDRYVAKLTFDHPRYVKPGLQIAKVLSERGITTGPPRLTRTGDVAVAVVRGEGLWTLALLDYVPGEPLDIAEPSAAGLAGDMLGRVHGTLLALPNRPAMPARTLEWLRGYLTDLGETTRLAVLAKVDEVRSRSPLTECIVYGDPSPEILQDRATPSIGLIDWGTPSWGPLVYDLATWAHWISKGPNGARRRDEFIRAYAPYNTLQDSDYRAFPLFTDLLVS